MLGALPDAHAATLQVGSTRRFTSLSSALAHARRGDRIVLAAGTYHDCAVIAVDDLTIEGAGSNTIVTGPACDNKALLVVTASHVTLRNFSLNRALNSTGDAAGIRLEGADLTVEHLRLTGNQTGIVANASPESSLIVRDSEFLQNGACTDPSHSETCAGGISADRIKLLQIERSRFFETHFGSHIKSRAARTEVLNCDLQDGARGNSRYQIELPIGGALLARGNVIEKGPLSQKPEAAINIGTEGVAQPTPWIVVSRNNFAVMATYDSIFVRNATETLAMLSGNRLRGLTGATPAPALQTPMLAMPSTESPQPQAQPLQGPGQVE